MQIESHEVLPPRGRFSYQPEEDELPLLSPDASDWDVATRYHELKKTASPRTLRELNIIAVDAILRRAQNLVKSVSRPTLRVVEEYRPEWDQRGEVAIEESLESQSDAVFLEHDIHRLKEVLICMDTSLSMTGEKLALTAVALAVVLLHFREDPVGVVSFENEATVLKHPWEKIGASEVLERTLDVPARGYTHLEAGLEKSLELMGSFGAVGSSSCILLTDGKYTAGKDPRYLAARFPHLIVVKMGEEESSLELCRELATLGRGELRQVEELQTLPEALYSAVKDLLRGRRAS